MSFNRFVLVSSFIFVVTWAITVDCLKSANSILKVKHRRVQMETITLNVTKSSNRWARANVIRELGQLIAQINTNKYFNRHLNPNVLDLRTTHFMLIVNSWEIMKRLIQLLVLLIIIHLSNGAHQENESLLPSDSSKIQVSSNG
jgi:hypothetical protein